MGWYKGGALETKAHGDIICQAEWYTDGRQ